jgi:hypothetical protein
MSKNVKRVEEEEDDEDDDDEEFEGLQPTDWAGTLRRLATINVFMGALSRIR